MNQKLYVLLKFLTMIQRYVRNGRTYSIKQKIFKHDKHQIRFLVFVFDFNMYKVIRNKIGGDTYEKLNFKFFVISAPFWIMILRPILYLFVILLIDIKIIQYFSSWLCWLCLLFTFWLLRTMHIIWNVFKISEQLTDNHLGWQTYAYCYQPYCIDP